MNNHTIVRLLIMAIYWVSYLPSVAQVGSLFIQNYSADELSTKFDAFSPQIWASVQDDRGVMYFANLSGLLEYDGVNWRIIAGTMRKPISALAKADNGKIYVGSKDDFGFLKSDSTGNYAYISLLDLVSEGDLGFDNVYNIHCSGESVFFISKYRVFRFKQGVVKSWEPYTYTSSFYRSFLVNKKLYVWQKNFGLMVLENEELKITPGGGMFNEEFVTCMLPYSKSNQLSDSLLIGSLKHGMYLYDGKQFTPFNSEVKDIISKSMLYTGVKLKDNNYALATIGEGVVIVDPNGNLLHVINEGNGLLDNIVLSLYADKGNGLWLGMQSGLSRVEIPSPITYYGKAKGVTSNINTIIRHKGNVYIGTTLGVQQLKSEEPDGQFKLLNQTNATCWDLISIGSTLFVGTHKGIYKIIADEMKTVVPDISVRVLYRSISDSNRIFIGTGSGLSSMTFENGKWNYGGEIKGVEDEIRSIVETTDGNLWCSYEEIYKVDFSNGFSNEPPVINFREEGESKGFFEDFSYGQFFEVDNENILFGNRGSYRYHQNQFVPDSTFGTELAASSGSVTTICADGKGKYFIGAGPRMGAIEKDRTGNYKFDYVPFLRIPSTQIWSNYFDGHGIVWYGTTKHLYRFDTGVQRNYNSEYSALIRNVISGRDSVLFYGTYYDAEGIASLAQPKELMPKLAYVDNSIIFRYGAPFFDNEEVNVFSYYLDGFEDQWSEGSAQSHKEYTNLKEGDYGFRVKARNVYGKESMEATYSFVILTPFYRSWWFYGAQIGSLMLLFVLSYYFGKAGGKLRRLAPAIATVAIVIIFEYFQNYVEDNFEHMLGGITFLKVLVNVLLVLLLLPLETILKRIIKQKGEKHD